MDGMVAILTKIILCVTSLKYDYKIKKIIFVRPF